MTDLRYAIRSLGRNPGFATLAVLTLALGIGANTAIFSVVHGVLLRPLPFPHPDRIVSVWTATANERRGNHSAGDFSDLRQENQSLSAIAGYRRNLFSVVAARGEPVQLAGLYTTAEFFDVLGVPATLGRTFSAKTDGAGRERLVVLSHSGWLRLYGERADAAGQRLRVDGQSHTLVGVIPPQTGYPEPAQIWVLSDGPVPPSPIVMDRTDPLGDRDVRYFEAIARVRPGVTLERAQQDLSRVATIVQRRQTQSAPRRDIRLGLLRDQIVGDVRFALLVLQGAVGLVLLIACANVSSLLLAEAAGRRRELAIRASLGAGRARLVRQLLAESLALGSLGGAVGLLSAAWLTPLLVSLLPDSIPRADEISLDFGVASVTLATALASGLLFGVVPALEASRADAATALKEGGERAGARARGRAALVVGEVAVTLVLLASAGLLLNSFLQLQRVDSGLDPKRVTVVPLVIPRSRYPTTAKQLDLYRRLIEGLSGRPGIESMGVGFPGPLRGGNASGTFFIEGRSSDPAQRPFANLGSVSGGYFPALGIPILEGRTFRDSDTDGAREVAIASVALARKYWPGESAIGKRLRFDDDPKAPWRTIVGVAGDVRQLGLDTEPPPILYIPYQQFPLPFTTVAIRSTVEASGIAALVRAQLVALDPDLAPGEIRTLQDVLDKSVEQPRFRTLVLSAFAVMALVLAAVGVYGLISHSVTQRTREIGIRMALGALPGQVLAPMLRQGLLLGAIGIAAGLIGSVLAGRVLESFLFGIEATDPLTFATMAALLLAVALLATYVPSRRALRIDPIVALKVE